MKKKKISTFYDDRMVLLNENTTNISKSPLKPKKILQFIDKMGFSEYFDIKEFTPFVREDFLIAHYAEYVDGFFSGKEPHASSNGLNWDPQFADSVKWTNASLYWAILNSIKNPSEVSFSNTSGFHHDEPDQGFGFCTFSGQVIASLKIFRELGLSGAYIDLDGHFGNSIEGSRYFNEDVNKAIPYHCNINPQGLGETYISNLIDHLSDLKPMILSGQISYLVFCHGADSHIWDDFGKQCNTEQWLRCSKIVYDFVKEIEMEMEKPLPLTLSLFGGYREDDYDSVLSLHLGDLVTCLNTLCGCNIEYQPIVKPKGGIEKVKLEIQLGKDLPTPVGKDVRYGDNSVGRIVQYDFKTGLAIIEVDGEIYSKISEGQNIEISSRKI